MKKLLPLALLIFILTIVSTVRADNIDPSQVLIVGNSQNTASLNLARQYAQARHIPSRNILMLDLPDAEQITREQYNHRIAYPIRTFIQRQSLQDKIKILVTIYGVPLKVDASYPNTQQRLLAQGAKQKYIAVFQQMENDYRVLEKLAGITTTQPSILPGHDGIDSFYRQIGAIVAKVTNLYRTAVPRVQKTSNSVDRQVLENQFIRIRLEFEGQLAMAAAMETQKEKNPQLLMQIQEKEKEFMSLLAQNPEKRDLNKTYQLARELGGYILELKTIYEDYWRLMQKESLAAVDSELSLVLWDDYPLAGKQPNPLNPRYASHYLAAGKNPVLMVSRLDGPTPQVVQRMIRDSIETEQNEKGLTGKFFLDARGITDKTGYFQYDEDLRKLYRQVQSHTPMTAVLDNRPEVFSPKSCPNTALYCGWYSLRNYVPAFTFVPGSVGYHIASFEAVSLKQKQSNLWVKRMLENGIAATVGPVEEPLLDAFPLPSEFFGLLMTGKYTLAEVFYRTNRYNSWRMILIGDPLYRPFAKHPLLDEKDVHLQPLHLLLVQ